MVYITINLHHILKANILKHMMFTKLLKIEQLGSELDKFYIDKIGQN